MGSAQDIPEYVAPAAELQAGTMVGGYQVTHKIGQGGMGQVYAAAHPLIGKKVAIKILAAHCVAVPDLVRRFIEEARAVNKIGHPHIVDIFAFGQLPDGRHFMVMEYLEGKNLAQRLEQETIPVPELRRLLRQMCEALQAAHDAGIVHRDLKPENIWIVQKPPEESHIKLLDFGIAKLLGVETGRITQTGAAMGTPQFMPPEQCLGRPIDHRADIYSFGIILYLIFTGTLPFTGSTLAEIVYRHTTEPPPPPSRFRPLPAALEKLILDCLAKDPELRPASAREVGQRLDAALTGAVTAATPLAYEAATASLPLAPRAAHEPPHARIVSPPRGVGHGQGHVQGQVQVQVQVDDPWTPAGPATTARLRPAGRTAVATVLIVLGGLGIAAGVMVLRTARVTPDRWDAAAAAAEARLAEAVASRSRPLEARAAAAARVPQLESTLDSIGQVDVAQVKRTVQDLFATEDPWAPFRAPPLVSAAATSEGMLASLGPGLLDVSKAALVRRARDTGLASGLLAGQDRAFLAAAALVGEKGRPGAPVVLLGVPLDQAAFQGLADQTGDAIGLSDGGRLLEGGGPQEPRRALAALARRSGRAAALDDAGAWGGTVVPLDGKLVLLSVFAAPQPPTSPRTATAVAMLGGALLLAGASLLLRARRRPAS